MTETIPRDRWSDRLERFTRENAGRRAILEVDESSIGAQRVAESPLWGVVYDPRDDEVEIMFGDFDEGRVQMTHAVPGATDVEILAGGADADAALRIGYARGQAILSILGPR